jgi:hypothetical protein
MLGHADSRMVERVYGRMPAESLKASLEARLGDCNAFATHTWENRAPERQERPSETALLLENIVSRDGIEPPTRGFSVQRVG